MTFYENLLSEIFGSLDKALDALEKFDGLTKASRFIKNNYGYDITRQTLANIMKRNNRTIPIQKHRHMPQMEEFVIQNKDLRPIDILRVLLNDDMAKSKDYLNLYQNIRTAKKRLPYYLGA